MCYARTCLLFACFALLSSCRYLHGNMADFALPSWNDKKGDKDGAGNNDGRLVDSAWCLLGSAGHLLTNEEMEGMLR